MKIRALVGEVEHDVLVDRHDGGYRVEVDGEVFLVDALKLEHDFYSILTEGRSYEVSVARGSDGYVVRHGAAVKQVRFTDPSRSAREAARGADGPEQVRTQMPGKVVRLLVAEGDTVEAGQGVAVVEAMKMENEIPVGRAGKVTSVAVRPGQAVEGGAVLLVVE